MILLTETMERIKKRSVFTIFNKLSPDGENSDILLKNSLLNGLTIIFVLVTLITLFGFFTILQPFIRPLGWALLVGSVLHPIKELIAKKCRKQIDKIELSPRPIYVNLALLPLDFLFKCSNLIGDFFLDHLIVIVKIFFAILTVCGFYFYTPNFIWRFFTFSMGINKFVLNLILNTFSSTIIVGTLVLSYVGALIFIYKPGYEKMFSSSSVLIYVAVTSWFSNFIPYLRIPTFVLFQIILCVPYIYGYYYLFFVLTKTKPKQNPTNASEENNVQDSNEKEPNELLDTTQKDDGKTSILYIRWLMIICSGILAFNISSVPYIFIVLILIYTIKKFCFYFGITEIFNTHANLAIENCKSWCAYRKNVLVPDSFLISLMLLNNRRAQFLAGIKESCDSVAAVIVIFGLLLFCIFFSLFFSFQAYREGVYLLEVGGSIVNSTVGNNPELSQFLPQDWQTTKNTALENAYVYVRDKLAQLIRNLLQNKGIDELKSIELEKGALELWDRAYEAWFKPLETNVKSPSPDAVLDSFTNYMERLKKTPEVVSWDSIRDLIQENMSTLKTGLDSLWSILRGNMSLLIGILTTLCSIIFDGGLSVINFLLNSVVFFISLFYLLSSSREVYKPVEMITQLIPTHGERLALAIEQSCREVLVASMKLSVFYGLWTWLIHTIFMSNFVYVPAAFAAILGVVPFLSTYWACFPAVLDLWLFQDSKLRALGLFLAQIFPTIVVETTIYNEIKGSGHPYLTGLSIAGGMFWLGIEGAIVGPLILCFVFTIVNMLTNLNTDET